MGLHLYLCDGRSCTESDKQCCFTQGGECKHTSNVLHAISRRDPYFPETYFEEHDSGNSWEVIDATKKIVSDKYNPWL